MANALDEQGRIAGMGGIQDAIHSLQLVNASFIDIGDLLNVLTTDFTIDAFGTITNDNLLEFTINAGDIGEIVTSVNIVNSSFAVLMQIDLDSSLTITHEGKASIAAGDLSAKL